MGLKRAVGSLISERYGSFIMTVGCIAVGISYCADNGHFKVTANLLPSGRSFVSALFSVKLQQTMYHLKGNKMKNPNI